MHIARFGELRAPPSPLDQAAAAIVVALDDDDKDKGFLAATEIFLKFNPIERFAIAMKAVALGADPKRVADANEATIDMPAVDVKPPGAQTIVLPGRVVYPNCKLCFLSAGLPVPVFTGAQAVDEVTFWVQNHKPAALVIALALAYGLWRVFKKGK